MSEGALRMGRTLEGLESPAKGSGFRVWRKANDRRCCEDGESLGGSGERAQRKDRDFGSGRK